MIRLAFFDLETDPFAKPGEHDSLQLDNLDISPFACGCSYADDYRPYFSAWGDNCIDRFMAEVDANPDPTIYYAHNGGKFDMRWILRFLPAQKFLEIKGRLVRASYGIHEFRDSFSLYALPLAALGGKEEIDYALMRRSVREAHREAIMRYLKADCDALRYAVTQLLDTVGAKRRKFTDIRFTAASIAFGLGNKEMQRARNASLGEFPLVKRKTKDSPEERDFDYPYTETIVGQCYPYFDFTRPRNKDPEILKGIINRKRKHDERFRPYYFGGITRVGKSGILEGEFTQIDAKSMYPSSMIKFIHPISDKKDAITALSPEQFVLDDNLEIVGYPGCVYAVEFIGESVGVLGAFREGVNTLDYRRDLNYMISHEFRACLELDTVRVEKVIAAYVFTIGSCCDFRPFAEKYFAQRVEWKKRLKESLSDEKAGVEPRNGYSSQYCKAQENAMKTILNSYYGKLAQDYRTFKDTVWIPNGDEGSVEIPAESIAARIDHRVPDKYEGYSNDLIGHKYQGKAGPEAENYYNVIAAASITSGARALLLRKMKELHDTGHEFIYCDTDSVLFTGVPTKEMASGEEKLGEWGIDVGGIYKVAIAGAKTYALWYRKDGIEQKPKCRSKGVRLTIDEIESIAANPAHIVEYKSEAPMMRVLGALDNLKRDVKYTANPVPFGSITEYKARGIEPRNLLRDDGTRFDELELRAMAKEEDRKAGIVRPKKPARTKKPKVKAKAETP